MATRSAGFAVAGRFGAIEGAGHPAEFVRREAGTAIKDTDRHVAPDLHLGAPRIFDRIVDQVADRPPDQVGLDLDQVRAIRREVDVAAEFAIFLGDRAGERGNIDALESLARATHSRQRENVLQRRGHLLDGRDHAVAVFLRLDGLGADSERGERGSEVMADRSQGAVLFVEQIGNAAVHGVERLDRIAEVGGTRRRDDHRLVSSAKGVGGARQRTQRPRKSQGDDHGGGNHEQVEQQAGEDQLRRDQRRRAGHRQASVDPIALGKLDRQKDGLRRTMAPAVRSPFRRPRVDRGAHIAHPEPGRPKRLAQSIFGIVAAAIFVGNRCRRGMLVARASARRVVQHQRLELGRGLGEVADRRGETRDRGSIDLRAVELLALREEEGEARELGEKQGDADQHRHLADQALGKQLPHNRRTSAASVYPPPHTVLISFGSLGSASSFLRRRLI